MAIDADHIVLKALIEGILKTAFITTTADYVLVDDTGKTLTTRIGELLMEIGAKQGIDDVKRIAGELITELIDGATTDGDTLKKLEDRIVQNVEDITAINLALDDKVDVERYEAAIDKINEYFNHTITDQQTQVLIDQAIDKLINGAPGTADTLRELNDLIEENREVIDAVNAAIGSKIDASTLQAAVDQLEAKINKKANADDVYTKEETDEFLDEKANADDVYTKEKTDELLDEKANADDVYTKEESNNALAQKANAANTYTKAETNELLDEKANADDVYTTDEIDEKFANFIPSGGGDTGNGDVGGGESSSTVSYTTINVTVDSDWSGVEEPYTKNVTVPGISANSLVLLAPNPNITEDKLLILAAAAIIGGIQSENTIQLLAYGDRPTVDIPLQITYFS